jgi:hypothetical protein
VSVATPVAQLALAFAAILGGLSGAAAGRQLAITCLLAIALLVVARAALIYRRAGALAPGGPAAALAIAATYDVARASALLVRARHHRRPAQRGPS